MSILQKTDKVYFENIDGLRFLAFLIVFISHATLFLGYKNISSTFNFIKVYVLANGDIGVSFFFVLSGFLITHLLLTEKGQQHTISLKKFYIRRILRIWPVYFVTLVCAFFVLPLFIQYMMSGQVLPFLSHPSLSVFPAYLFFLANFSLAFHGSASVPADILWSISVEEQFYLLWPWIIAIVPVKHIPKVILGIVICSCLYRFGYAGSPDVLAYSTFSVMSDLAIGAFLGWVLYAKEGAMESAKHVSKVMIVAVYSVLPVLIIGRHYIASDMFSPLVHQVGVVVVPLVLSLLYAFVIFEQSKATQSIYKIGKSKALTFLGKISYGLYTYHMIAISMVLIVLYHFVRIPLVYDMFWYWLVTGFLSLFITFGISFFSYKYFEKWFLSKKPI